MAVLAIGSARFLEGTSVLPVLVSSALLWARSAWSGMGRIHLAGLNLNISQDQN